MSQELTAHPCRPKRMTTAEFIAHLRTLDIRLFVDGERLRCSAPKGMLTDRLREELAARKAEILVWLMWASAYAPRG